MKLVSGVPIMVLILAATDALLYALSRNASTAARVTFWVLSVFDVYVVIAIGWLSISRRKARR
jgi:hypothetical protein